MGDDDFLSRILRVGVFIISVLAASLLYGALEEIPEVVPPYAVIPITVVGFLVSGSLATAFTWRRRKNADVPVLTKLWRGELDQSDKEDIFIILSITLLVTWYDHSIGYRLGVAGVYIALGTAVAVSLLWRRWTTGRWKPISPGEREGSVRK